MIQLENASQYILDIFCHIYKVEDEQLVEKEKVDAKIN